MVEPYVRVSDRLRDLAEGIYELADVLDGLAPRYGKLRPSARRLLPFLVRGWTNAQMGKRHGITEKTVKNTVMEMCQIYDVPNRTALVGAVLAGVTTDWSDPDIMDRDAPAAGHSPHKEKKEAIGI